jgi:hypothetical protein
MSTLFSNTCNLCSPLKKEHGLERNWQNDCVLVSGLIENVFKANNSKYFQDYSSPDFMMNLIFMRYLLVLFKKTHIFKHIE